MTQPQSTTVLVMDFAYIPPGTFMMGSSEDELGRDADEKRHQVTLTRGYYLQTTPVTQAQWEVVMGNNPSYFEEAGPNAPVEKVSWEDVQEFIEMLNSRTDSYRFRLPSEAEWEYACRAGAETAFCNGPITDPSGRDPNLDKVGWFDENSGGTTHLVGQKEPNAWGLYDMHGNVWEWCADWSDSYPDGPVTDPTGSSTGSTRVLRGGSWYSYAWHCRSANRFSNLPSIRSNNIGFRLAMIPVLQGPQEQTTESPYDPKSRYYDAGGIETIDYIRAKLTPEQYKGYLLGNILKYVSRMNFKGRPSRDTEKTAQYVQWLHDLEQETKEGNEDEN